MRKVAFGCVYFLLFISFSISLYSQTNSRQNSFEIAVYAEPILNLTVAMDQSMVIKKPLELGIETVSAGLRIELEGNEFNLGPADAYVVIRTDYENDDYRLLWGSGSVTLVEGELNVAAVDSGAIEQQYKTIVYDASGVNDGAGKFIFEFDLLIEKFDRVSAGNFHHTIMVQAAADGSITP